MSAEDESEILLPGSKCCAMTVSTWYSVVLVSPPEFDTTAVFSGYADLCGGGVAGTHRDDVNIESVVGAAVILPVCGSVTASPPQTILVGAVTGHHDVVAGTTDERVVVTGGLTSVGVKRIVLINCGVFVW